MLAGGPPPRPKKPASMNSMVRPGIGHSRQDSTPLPPPPTFNTRLPVLSGYLYKRNRRGLFNGIGPRLWAKVWFTVDPRTGVMTTMADIESDLSRKRQNVRPDLESDRAEEPQNIDMLATGQRHENLLDNIARIVVPSLNRPKRFNILFKSGFVYELRADDHEHGEFWIKSLNDIVNERLEFKKSPHGGRMISKQPALLAAAQAGVGPLGTRQHYAESMGSDSDDSANGYYFDDDSSSSSDSQTEESDSESEEESGNLRDTISIKKMQKLISRIGTKDRTNKRNKQRAAESRSDSSSSSSNPAAAGSKKAANPASPPRTRYRVRPAKKVTKPSKKSSGSSMKGKKDNKISKKKSGEKHRKSSSKSSSKSASKEKRPGITTGNPLFGSRRLRVSAPGFPLAEVNLVHGEHFKRSQGLRSTFVVDTKMLTGRPGVHAIPGKPMGGARSSRNVVRKRRRSRSRRHRPRMAVVPKLVDEESNRSLLSLDSRHTSSRKIASMALRRTSTQYATKKNKQTKQLLRDVIESSRFQGKTVVFEDLDSNGISDLVNSMYRVDVHSGDVVVRQGVSADTFYIIEKGSFRFYSRQTVGPNSHFNGPIRTASEKSMNAAIHKPMEDFGNLLTTQGARTFFGELSMLYEQPGNITVVAEGNGTLWAIKRATFHNITTTAAVRRHNDRLRFLNNIPLIRDSLDAMSIIALADAMEVETYENKEVIVNIGVDLKKMYIVQEGTAAVVREDWTIQDQLRVGECFGEWALLDPESLTENILIGFGPKTTMLSLDIAESEELIGPLREKVAKRVQNAAFSGGLVARRLPGSQVSAAPRPSFTPYESLRNSSLWRPSLTKPTFGSMMESSLFDSNRLSASKYEFDPDQEQAVSLALEDAKLRFTGRSKVFSMSDKRFMSGLSDAKGSSSTSTSSKSTRHTRESSMALRQTVRKTLEGTIASMVGAQESEEVLDQPWTESEPLLPDIDIDDLLPVRLLGRGSFGRVHLVVQEDEDEGPNSVYALKVISRHYIVTNGWEKLILNERAAMLELSQHVQCPFILNIFNTYVDEKNVYLLLELCEGGDFYELVREQPDYKLSEVDTKFYIGCVVLGLTAMHERNILYRDLKPENLMINSKGYIKIADFGLAKKSLRTFTVCGTPDYMAPETILSRGHDIGVDWWALGVLLYEVIQGETPFYGREQLQIYDNIIAHEADDLVFHDEDTEVTEECKEFIKKLLHPKKTKRLGNIKSGVEGILFHPFFNGFEWEGLSGMTLEPPLMPEEMAHFERFKDMHPVDDDGYDPEFYNAPDDMSGWDPDF